MNWNEYRTFHKDKHGTTSVAVLSKNYKIYKKQSPNVKKSPTRGWSKASPKKGTERHILKETCGDSAFLDPKHEKYPVKNQKCQYVCKGVASAKNRACQYGHSNIADKAQKVGEKYCNFSPKKHACKK